MVQIEKIILSIINNINAYVSVKKIVDAHANYFHHL